MRMLFGKGSSPHHPLTDAAEAAILSHEALRPALLTRECSQAPEMVRVPLEELVLQIHLLGLGPAGEFLEKVLEPPPKASVEGALTHLQALGALTPDQQLTPLGQSAASFITQPASE